MKRRFTILTAALALLTFLAVPMGMRGQTTVTWPGTSALPGTATAVANDQNVTIKTSSTNTYTNPIRIYANTTVTINVLNGAKILSVAYEASSTGNYVTYAQNATVTPNVTPTVSDKIVTWTYAESANVTEFTFKPSSQTRSNGISITYKISGGDTPQPTTYTVTYDCNGGTSGCPQNVTGIEPNTQIQLADAPSKDGFDFDGWSDGNTTYGENEDYTVTGNVTFTAQWTEQASGDVQWVLTNLADLTENDVFVIVGNNGSNYAMSNNNGTNGAPSAVAVTVENGLITSTVVSTIQWTISGNASDGYTFYPNGSTTTWLYCTNTNNGVRVGTNNDKTFKMDNNSGYLKHDGTSRFVGIYNSADWRCYTSAGGNIANQTFAFYKKVTGGIIPPSISADNVSIAYDDEEGTITYTINNEPTPAGTLTATTTAEWLTIGTVGNNVPFTCTANDATTERTATVTLTYTYERATVTKDVTVTQAAAPVVYTTIPALFEAATSTETSVLVTFNNWVVSGVSTNGKNVFVTDNEGHGFVIFSSSDMSNTYAAGNVLSGTAVTCTLKLYNGFAELLNVNATDLTITTGGTVTTADIAMAELAGVNTGALVHYENLTCSVDNNKYYLSDGTTTIQVYNSLFAFGALTDGTAYNITGVYQQFNNTKEVLPRSAADIEEVAPVLVASITVNPDVVELDAEEHDGTLDLTYENLTITEMSDFDIQFCDANGDELSEEPDWIEVLVAEQDPQIGNGYVVSYYMVENEGPDARTAYFKVYAMDDETNLVYSNLVTISQAAPVAPVTGDKYVKVTSTADLTSGQYLIVYEDGSLAFDGSLETLDEASNTIEVTINDSEIGIDNITIASEFTIDVTTGTIMSASGYYIGQTSNANGMQTSLETAYTNTISFDESGNANIVSSGGAYLRYNSASNQNRFRYYKSSSYTAQKAIQLYKKVVEPATETYTLEIAGYGNSDGGYYLIASPVVIDPMTVEDPESHENMILTDDDALNYDLYYFDESKNEEWRNYKDNAFNLVPGKGYLYAHKRGGNFAIVGVPYSGDGKVTLHKTGGAYWEGWNLIGNPWGTAATIETEEGQEVSFYVMGDDGMSFIPGDNYVDPMQGIFVIAASDEQEVTFVPAETPAPGEGKLIVNLTASRSSVIDRAIVRFGQGTELPKFMFNPNSTKIYIPQSGEDYAVVRSAGEAEMPVNFKAAQNGTYTLSINPANVEMEYLHLVDNMTGTDIDLLETPSYTFEASTTDAANRFSLMYGVETGVNEDKAANFAYFNGSQWVVNNSGEATLQVVDALGRVVSTKTINGNAEVSIDQTAGVYMIRLINGNNVKTQKVVVK